MLLFFLPFPYYLWLRKSSTTNEATPPEALLKSLALLSKKKWDRPFVFSGNGRWQACFQALNQLRITLQAYQHQYQEEKKREQKMQEVSLILTRFAPPEKIFPEILPHFSQFLQAQAAIFLRKGEKLVEYTTSSPPFSLAIGEGLAGLCAKQKSRVLANWASRHPDFVPSSTSFRHLLCLPLLAADEVIGVVSFYREEDPPFTEEEVEKVEPLVRLIAAYLQNITLQNRLIVEPKTGLYIYPYFERKCQEEQERARRYRIPFSVILLDIDYFKKINDHYGHLVGDQVLLGLAKIIREEIRELDIACRFGGEEFMLLLPSTKQEEAHACAERLLKKVRESVLLPENQKVTISAGVAEADPVTLPLEEIFKRADAALYQAKAAGRNQVCVYFPTQK